MSTRRRRRHLPSQAAPRSSATTALLTSFVALSLLLASQCSDSSVSSQEGGFLHQLVTTPALHLPKSATQNSAP